MKKIRLLFPKGFWTSLPLKTGDIFPLADEGRCDASEWDCYGIIMPDESITLVNKRWAEVIPEFQVELPEDLFDL